MSHLRAHETLLDLVPGHLPCRTRSLPTSGPRAFRSDLSFGGTGWVGEWGELGRVKSFQLERQNAPF